MGVMRRARAAELCWMCWMCSVAMPGCSAQVEGGAEGPYLARRGLDAPSTAHDSCGGERLGSHAALRRLTRTEFENTVRDLFEVEVPGLFPATDTHRSRSGFTADPSANGVSELGAERIEQAAEAAALGVVAELERHVSCGRFATQRECAQAFIEEHGPRVLRRELRGTEQTRLLRVFDAASQDGLEVGIAAVVSTLLQTPDFLYLTAGLDATEEAGGRVPLSGPELAAQLSYLLWDGPPDATLWAAARSGSLDSAEGLTAHVYRMLDDPRAGQPLADFARQWAGFERVEPESRDSEWLTPELSEALRSEFDLFASNALAHGDLAELLGSAESYANGPLRELYGLSSSGRSDAFTRVALDPAQRAGILTQPALLMALAHRADTSYVQRGKFVLEKLLCQELPTPPDNALTLLPETSRHATNRQRSRDIRQTPGCGRCHERLDPIGLAFEGYDWLGQYREFDEAGSRIDTSGRIVGVPGLEAPFNGVVELAELLVRSPEVRACVARSFFRFALSHVEEEADRCALAELQSEFEQGDGELRELMVRVVTSDAFRARQHTGETL